MASEVAQLIVQLDGQVMRTVELNAPVLTIGRRPDNGLVLAHPSVSPRHAELRVEDAGVQLTDLESQGGTLLDTRRLLPNQPQLLSDGNSFQIGPFVLIYRTVGATVPAPGAPATAAPAQPVAPLLPIAPPERPCFPRPQLPRGQRSRYLQHLPGIYQEPDQADLDADQRLRVSDPYLSDSPHLSSFLNRFLLICETIWEPYEQRQDYIELYFDPRTCPSRMLPWLASWLGLQVNVHWPEPRLRALLSVAMDLYRWRGTSDGLTRIIEACTGLAAEVSDERGAPYVIRVVVHSTNAETMDSELLDELIQTHKPAHVGYILELRP